MITKILKHINFETFMFRHITYIAISKFSEYLTQYCLCDFRRLCNRKHATFYAKIINEATKSITKLKLIFLCKKSMLQFIAQQIE